MTAQAAQPRYPDWDQKGIALPFVTALRKTIEAPQPVDGDWMDALLTQLSQQLYAVYRDQDVDRALQGMHKLMARYDQHERECHGASRPPAGAAERWSRITQTPYADVPKAPPAQASPPQPSPKQPPPTQPHGTIVLNSGELILPLGAFVPDVAERVPPHQPLAQPVNRPYAAVDAFGRVIAPPPAADMRGPRPTPAVQPLRNPPSPAARQPTPNPPAVVPSPKPQAPNTSAAPTPAANPHVGKLDAAAMDKSIVPTWLALVVLSWFSLAWGALISLPFGVGMAIAASFLGGIISVPVWGTVFGFLGMSSAKHNTLHTMGFQKVGSDHPLHAIVSGYARDLGMPVPQIGTMPVFNAFAMGMNRSSATIAVGQPLLHSLTPDEVAAVVGHELGHIATGDMRRMMLMRTFQNATVWYMGTQRMKHFVRYIVCWAAELHICGSSRRREFWADAFGAALAGKAAMISALRKLEAGPSLSSLENTHARFMFKGRVLGMFSTHPPFEQRIAALQNETYMRRLPRKA